MGQSRWVQTAPVGRGVPQTLESASGTHCQMFDGEKLKLKNKNNSIYHNLVWASTCMYFYNACIIQFKREKEKEKERERERERE